MDEYLPSVIAGLVITMLVGEVLLWVSLNEIDDRGLICHVFMIMKMTSVVTACIVILCTILYLQGSKTQRHDDTPDSGSSTPAPARAPGEVRNGLSPTQTEANRHPMASEVTLPTNGYPDGGEVLPVDGQPR